MNTFGNRSIKHQFEPFFHCYKQKFMARKREGVFHPGHLYCVTTLPSKTNTTANRHSW